MCNTPIRTIFGRVRKGLFILDFAVLLFQSRAAMAPRVAAFQFAGPEVNDDAVEYGYWQIDDYVSQKKKGVTPGAKHWVPLPRGTHVHSYTGCVFEAQQRQVAPHALRSCLRHAQFSVKVDMDACETMSTTSTVASSSDDRRVHFRDGLLPGCLQGSSLHDEDMMDIPEEFTAPLADWIFVDRDICGFSLHEYAPNDIEIQDFASSPYACMFLQELAAAEFANSYDQQLVTANTALEQQYRHEERHLDKALFLAGTHVNYLHATPEESELYCEMSI